MTIIPADILDRLRACKIIPVITLKDVSHAVPLAEALIAAGVDVLEVTLRTPAALDCIQAIADAGLDALIGAGTVTRPDHVEAAKSAGAQFLVTPGTAPTLLPSLKAFDGPVFPGVASVSEALHLRDEGFVVQKFFPAEAAGGVSFLKSIASPIPDITFMPTGGVSPANARDYLNLPNVIAIGGSWIVPNDVISDGRWSDITSLAATAREIN